MNSQRTKQHPESFRDKPHHIPIFSSVQKSFFDFIHKSLTTGANKAFAQFPGHFVEALPCKIDNDFIKKSETLLHSRELDENVENEINQLVYQLYDLTAEEIAIIENSVK